MHSRWKILRLVPAAIIAASAARLPAQSVPLNPASPPPQPATAPARPGPPAISTSASGQFSIHGGDLTMRSAFCVLCDETAAALGRLLHDGARYLLPVVVVLKTPPNVTQTDPAVSWNISQLAHGGFHLQLNAQLRPDFRGDDFARELVRLLIAERILRNHKELKTSRQNVLPNWVLTGVTQAMEFRSRSRPSAMFAAVFRSGQVYSIDRILAADPVQLDALARGIYESSSCALVLALLDQKDGPLRFAKFLDSLAVDSKTDRDLLRQHFPTLGVSKNSLEKWWTLQMATLATPSPLETLSIADTEAKLDEALTLVFDAKTPEEKKKEAAEKEKDEKRAPDKKKTSSVLRSSPVFQPWIVEIIRDLAPAFGGEFIAAAKEPDAEPDTKNPPDKKKADLKKKESTEAKPDEKPVRLRAEAHRAGQRPALPMTEAEKKKLEEEKKKAEAAQKKQAEAAEKKRAEEQQRKAEAEKKNLAGQTNADASKASEPRKRSAWNPLNWFRSRDKTADDPKNDAGKPDKPKIAKTASAPEKETPPARTLPSSRHDPKVSGPPIEEFATIAKRSDRARILQRNLEQLSALKVQAHPLYRELIGEYAEAVRLIATGKDRKMPEALAALRERRKAVGERALAVESHVDWYEASQTRSYSGMFEDYLKLCDKLEKEIRTRTDAVSKYLDLVEKEYEN